ncbi:MAG: Glu-tRNA(Gln) amidotransferase subunit GatD [archaeon]
MEKLEEKTIYQIKTRKDVIEGIFIPSHEKDIILLKQKTGYNIGIKKKEITEVKKLKKLKEMPEIKVEQDKKLPGIAILNTGGTILSKVDYRTGGVYPIQKPSELLEMFPDIKNQVKITEIASVVNTDSSNITPKHWKLIAKKVAELLNKPYNQGIIITHGTDTIHYTSAALSFMLKNLGKPVILTYSQKSVDRGSSDAFMNIKCAIHAAISNIAGVFVVGHENSDDNFCSLHLGTKVRKMHSSKRDAFKSINETPVARIDPKGEIHFITEKFKKKDQKLKAKIETDFEEKVAIIKFYPGIDPDILDYYIKKKYKGIIIEGFGLGQITNEGKYSWLNVVKKAIEKGIQIYMTTQTIYGRVDPYVYTPAREFEKLGVIYLKDLHSETAYVKLGWCLANKKSMLDNISHEFNEKLAYS